MEQPPHREPRTGREAIGLESHSLVGSFFHSFDHDAPADGPPPVEWQGQVVAEPTYGSGVYLVQLFDWMVGGKSIQQLVRLEDMADWVFYDTADEMNHSYERRYASRGRGRDE
jgi:hypothetical protein